MFFTQEDYQKIEEYLRLNAMKDTDFRVLYGKTEKNPSEISGDDWVSGIQYSPDGNHKNVRIQIKNLVNYFLTDILDRNSTSAEGLIDDVPTRNSNNLVRSGGVWQAILDSEQLIDNKILADDSVDERVLTDQVNSKISRLTATLTAGTSTTKEITGNPIVIPLTATATIDTFGDFGSTPAEDYEANFSVSHSNLGGGTIDVNGTPASYTETSTGYDWTLANIVGTQTATYTVNLSGVQRSASVTAHTYLRKYFAFMDTAPSTVNDMIDLQEQGKAASSAENTIKCTVTVPPNGTDNKHVYIAIPDNFNFTGHTIIQTLSQLNFDVEYQGVIYRTISSNNESGQYAYNLYKSFEAPDSSVSKPLKID